VQILCRRPARSAVPSLMKKAFLPLSIANEPWRTGRIGQRPRSGFNRRRAMGPTSTSCKRPAQPPRRMRLVGDRQVKNASPQVLRGSSARHRNSNAEAGSRLTCPRPSPARSSWEHVKQGGIRRQRSFSCQQVPGAFNRAADRCDLEGSGRFIPALAIARASRNDTVSSWTYAS